MRKGSAGKGNQEGSVLFLALVLVVAMSAGASLAWMRMHQEMDRQQDMRQTVAAQWIAEGGIQYALQALREDPSFRGVEQQALGEGFFRVTVAPQDDAFVVASRGWFEDGSPAPAAINLLAKMERDAAGDWVVEAYARERTKP